MDRFDFTSSVEKFYSLLLMIRPMIRRFSGQNSVSHYDKPIFCQVQASHKGFYRPQLGLSVGNFYSLSTRKPVNYFNRLLVLIILKWAQNLRNTKCSTTGTKYLKKRRIMMTGLRKLVLAVGLAGVVSTSATAGSIYLTGHDTLLHDGQRGYDNVILDFLRGAGTASEVAKASYDIAVLGSGVGSWGWSDSFSQVKPDYASTTYFNVNTLDDAGWGTALAADVLVILSHTSCGGCDLNDAGVIAINARSAQIATAFNAGMDIWGNSGARNADYYDFLPPSVTTTGPPISGSSGFVATAAGTALGITNSMINGFPTHNRFVDFASAFTVFETRPITGGGDEVISIGVRDGTIVDDGIVVDDGGDGTVPEPATLGLLGLGALAFGFTRRRKQ